jgi:hypothetical protein
MSPLSTYVKYFDYSLAELLVNHSTDPMQNTVRQYMKSSSTFDRCDQGRFADHHMIIRRQGKTNILRAKQDTVLACGYARYLPTSPHRSLHSSTMMNSSCRTTTSTISMTKKMSMIKSSTKPSRIYARQWSHSNRSVTRQVH